MSHVFRVPTKAWYRKHRLDKNKKWDDVYAKRCISCKQKFKEKDVYTVEKDGYRHVECKAKKNVKNSKDKVRMRQPKMPTTSPDIHGEHHGCAEEKEERL